MKQEKYTLFFTGFPEPVQHALLQMRAYGQYNEELEWTEANLEDVAKALRALAKFLAEHGVDCSEVKAEATRVYVHGKTTKRIPQSLLDEARRGSRVEKDRLAE